MKKWIWIALSVVAALALAGGGFWAGMTYQASQAAATRNNFYSQRGGAPTNGTMPNGGAMPSGGQGGQGGMMRGGVSGQIKTVDGSTLTISTPQNVTTVVLTADTVIKKTTTGAASDLQTGLQVMITGKADDKGTVTATQITIVDGSFTAGAKP
ncbi:MAG TPA: DUF5666 domain-containing protein [Anaerolineaceae bacterium]|nr:DUF5666 domain-containing protein [Anaerolineaceae bacterium]HPN54039.1 DUF5666 domain-containing protein [Anaerolineaceae bacterium]